MKAIAVFASVAAAVACGAGEVKVEKLDDGIWRVRMERSGKWPESGLNRYSILEDLGAQATASLADLAPLAPEMKHVGAGFRIRLPLGKDTRVYGLGDASRDNIQRRPGRYEIHVKNIHSYIPVPVLFTTEGWGVLVNSTWLHTIDVGQEDPDAVVVAVSTIWSSQSTCRRLPASIGDGVVDSPFISLCPLKAWASRDNRWSLTPDYSHGCVSSQLLPCRSSFHDTTTGRGLACLPQICCRCSGKDG